MLNINIWKVISIKHDTDTEYDTNMWTLVKHIKFNPDTSRPCQCRVNTCQTYQIQPEHKRPCQCHIGHLTRQGIGMLDRVISDLHHQPQFFSDSKIHPLASEQGNLSCASQHNTHTLCQFTWCKTLHMLGCDLLYLVNYPSIRSCCMHVSLT